MISHTHIWGGNKQKLQKQQYTMAAVILYHCSGIKLLESVIMHNQANKGLEWNNNVYRHNMIAQQRITFLDN